MKAWEEKLYRAVTVTKVTGLKPITLRQWHLRNIYQPETELVKEYNDFGRALGMPVPEKVVKLEARIDDAKRKGWRLYKFADIVRIIIILRLTRSGVTTERAALIAQNCHIDPDSPNPNPVLTVSFQPDENEQREIEEGKHYLQVLNPDQDPYEKLIEQATENIFGGYPELSAALAKPNSTHENFSKSVAIIVNVSDCIREAVEGLKALDDSEAGA